MVINFKGDVDLDSVKVLQIFNILHGINMYQNMLLLCNVSTEQMGWVRCPKIIIIMCIYHALINALSAHMIHINLNMIFYTHVKHSPTKTIYTHTHTLTVAETGY